MRYLRRRSDRLRRWWPLFALTLVAVTVFVLLTGVFVGRQIPEARLEKDLAPLNAPRVLRAERIALEIWGPVCGGDVAVSLADLEDDQAGQASWLVDDDGGYYRCAIIVAPHGPNGKPWPFRLLCAVVVHEVGHLAGMKHSANPRSVMYPRCSEKNIPPRCRA